MGTFSKKPAFVGKLKQLRFFVGTLEAKRFCVGNIKVGSGISRTNADSQWNPV